MKFNKRLQTFVGDRGYSEPESNYAVTKLIGI